MNNDRWVMVRDFDTDEWAPRIFMRDLGAINERYLCLAGRGNTCAWREMRPATARELLPCLPREWAARAMKRAEEGPNNPDAVVYTLSGAICCAFNWEDTPEGSPAWKRLYDALNDGTEIPPEPYADAKAALADGELEIRQCDGTWCKISYFEPKWDLPPEDYRRCPKPECPECPECKKLRAEVEQLRILCRGTGETLVTAGEAT